MLGWPEIAVLALGAVAVVMLVRFIRCWIADPPAAMRMSTHHPDLFPQVMAGRYIFMVLVLLGAMATLNILFMAFVFAALAFLGFYDAAIYARAGRPHAKHLQAGIACVLAVAICAGIWTLAP